MGVTFKASAQIGTGNIGYKAMDKLKQRVCDVVSHNKNIELLQTKSRVLMEEVAQVQNLVMTGENDAKDEVHNWFTEASEILEDANGILGGRDKKRLCSTCWDPTTSWQTGKMLTDIDEVLEKRKVLNLSSYFCRLFYCNKLQSRENKLQDIMEALMDIHINMIGINGMIGVGKTAIAKELARRSQNNQLFDVVVMVQVSESVDVKLIQSQISKKIGLQLSEADDQETRARLLHNVIEEKIMERGQESGIEPVQQSKILLIIDGIQHVFDLTKVGIRVKGTSTCKVVLLSRNAGVCKEMGAEKNFSVECLNLDEAKILFEESLKDKIQSMEITTQKYQHMESVMLMQCGGLPLMIYSLTCALRSMSWSNWEILADQMLRHTLLKVDEIKEASCAILELYNNFIRYGNKHKLFLLCCLILEQGVDVPLERLKRYGIGFGLFDEDSLSPDVDQMNLWVHELKSLSILLEAKPQHVKIHDVIKNVGISALSQGNDLLPVLLDVGTCWHTRESYENCVAISMMSDSNYKCLKGLELNKLEALLLKDIQSLSLPGNFFRGMPGLKVLEISGTMFVDLPASIRDLKNLVTLHLEYCYFEGGEIISKISELEKLQVLSLRGSRIKVLSEEIGKLANLRVLDLSSTCRYLRIFPVDAVVKMVRLKELYLDDSYSEWNSDDTKKLSKLPLEVIEIIITRQISSGLNLDFVNLRRFSILIGGRLHRWEFVSCFSRVLVIKNYNCLEVLESGLRNLLPRTELLWIEEVTGLSNSIADLYGHVFLNLKSIFIGRCYQMKCILDACRDAFPELEILTLESLTNLTSICCCQPRFNFFPQLRELKLTNLRQLHPYVLPAQFAARLRVMEVSECINLLYIFPSDIDNDTDAAELSLELPYMERLVLTSLHALQSLQQPKEDSIKEDERGLLFNGKIKLPSLKEMHLGGLNQFKNVWDLLGSQTCIAELSKSQVHGISPWFGNLRSMTVSERKNINSLFTSKILNSLLQLETLIVKDCHEMVEVITSSSDAEDDTNAITMILFPRLKVLELESLGSLQCFYRGCHWLKFPMLKSLYLSGLTEMKAFIRPSTQSVGTEGTILFDGEIDLPCLEHLEVSGMDNIELLQRHGETTIFSHLSRLTLIRLPKLKALPSIHSKTLRFLNLEKIECCKVLISIQPTHMSPIVSWELEELVLSESNSLEELFYDENPVDKLLFSLKKLKLYNLCKLRTIPWNMLRNLRSLIIGGLRGWTKILSTNLLVGGSVLPLLEYIAVQDCFCLNAIISLEELLEEDEQDLFKYGITLFPSLKEIQLNMLPELESFSKGSYEAHFPSLETVDIFGCNSFQSFSFGPIRTPRLKSLLMDSKAMNVDTFDDLNSAVKASIYERFKDFSNLIQNPKEVQELISCFRQQNQDQVETQLLQNPKSESSDFNNPKIDVVQLQQPHDVRRPASTTPRSASSDFYNFKGSAIRFL
ncbi:hypothetical protein V2J09_022032 [Rumex salicifolius]